MKNIVSVLLQTPGFDLNAMLILILFLGILAYVGYLHYQLSQRNLFLNALVEAMHKIDKTWQRDDIFKFLRKLQNTEISGLLTKDHIFDQEIMDYIFENEDKTKLFLHYTMEKSVADVILNQGFKFSDNFHKTAESIYNDKIDFVYKHNIRKRFGKYVVIIAFHKDLYEDYLKKLSQISALDFSVEHILTENFISSDNSTDYQYLMSNKYIKGYINIETGEVVKNPGFKPDFKSKTCDENFEKIKTLNKQGIS